MTRLYYLLKPSIPRFLQLFIRKIHIKSLMIHHKDSWPVLSGSEKKPENWKGWPDGKKFALVLTHDVEHQAGHDMVKNLLLVEKEMGFVSSFNFVPKISFNGSITSCETPANFNLRFEISVCIFLSLF